MLLSRSSRRKFVATSIGALVLASLFEVTVFDSRFAAKQAEAREETARPAAGIRLKFTATAYCKGTTTASGVNVRTGIAAADPDLLPVGSVIQVDRLEDEYNGIYTILDTGPKVHGRHVDIYMWSCHKALELGRKPIQLTVLRLGWNPKASAPSLIERLFRQRESNLPPPPPWPPAPAAPESREPATPATLDGTAAGKSAGTEPPR
jgi:3D (Asp-Asp-Asp) domain-containing protein